MNWQGARNIDNGLALLWVLDIFSSCVIIYITYLGENNLNICFNSHYLHFIPKGEKATNAPPPRLSTILLGLCK